MYSKNFMDRIGFFSNKRIIFFLNIIGFSHLNGDNPKTTNEFDNKIINLQNKFNKISLIYYKNKSSNNKNKNTSEIIEISKLNLYSKLGNKNGNKSNIKFEFNFNGKILDLWNLFFFKLRYMRLSLLDLINKKPEFKKYFTSMDMLEVFALLIDLIFFNDYFNEILTEEERKFVNEEFIHVLSGLFDGKIDKKEQIEILEKIKKILKTILNNLSSKSNIEININGKNIPSDVVKKLLEDKDMVEILSTSYLIFLDTIRLFYVTQILSLNDKTLTEFINTSKKNNSNDKKDPLELDTTDDEDLT